MPFKVPLKAIHYYLAGDISLHKGRGIAGRAILLKISINTEYIFTWRLRCLQTLLNDPAEGMLFRLMRLPIRQLRVYR